MASNKRRTEAQIRFRSSLRPSRWLTSSRSAAPATVHALTPHSEMADESSSRSTKCQFRPPTRLPSSPRVQYRAYQQALLRPRHEPSRADRGQSIRRVHNRSHSQITKRVISGVYAGVTTVELDNLAAETAAYMTTKHPGTSVHVSRSSSAASTRARRVSTKRPRPRRRD